MRYFKISSVIILLLTLYAFIFKKFSIIAVSISFQIALLILFKKQKRSALIITIWLIQALTIISLTDQISFYYLVPIIALSLFQLEVGFRELAKEIS